MNKDQTLTCPICLGENHRWEGHTEGPRDYHADCWRRVDEAWIAAHEEGFEYFVATTHVGGDPVSFVGQSWTDGGYSVNDEDNPVRDALQNTVADYSRQALDLDCLDHVRQVMEWYYGS